MGIQRRHSDCFDSGQPRGGLISQNTATQRAAVCIAACSTRRHSDWAASNSRSNSIPGNQADIRFPLWCGVVGLPKGFTREARLKYFVKTNPFYLHHTTQQHSAGFYVAGYSAPGFREVRRASDSQCGHVVWCGPIW